MTRSLVSPSDQKVTFVELFFDLVFVFSVTQVVSLLHHGLTWPVAAQALLIFWLVWWAWTQFTWALNAADTTHPLVELGTLAATAIAFFMAVAVPGAFTTQPLAFAVPYVLVRALGLYIYSRVACENPSQRKAVTTFTVLSATGLIAVLAGGLSTGPAQYWMWGSAILLDVIAAAIGGRQQGWDLHPDHFGERHGLFVIIALGETLIVAASGLSEFGLQGVSILVAVLSVAITCGLWWIYFTWAKPELDRALEHTDGVEQSTMARDVFSLIHFPMLCGIVAYAYAIGEAMRHPAEAFDTAVRAALAAGILLFAGGMAAAMWRANGRLLVARKVITVAVSIGVILLPAVPAVTLAIVLSGVVAIAFIETRALPAVRTVAKEKTAKGR